MIPSEEEKNQMNPMDFEEFLWALGDNATMPMLKKFMIIELKNINSYKKEDSCLIKICEQLVREGYFEAFEYTYQYLLNYYQILPTKKHHLLIITVHFQK